MSRVQLSMCLVLAPSLSQLVTEQLDLSQTYMPSSDLRATRTMGAELCFDRTDECVAFDPGYKQYRTLRCVQACAWRHHLIVGQPERRQRRLPQILCKPSRFYCTTLRWPAGVYQREASTSSCRACWMCILVNAASDLEAAHVTTHDTLLSYPR